MNILFLHRTFPGQFKHLAPEFAKDPNNVVIFVAADDKAQLEKVKKITYKPNIDPNKVYHPYVKGFEECVIHGESAASVMLTLRQNQIIPDVIIGFSWGPPMFVREIFSDVPYLCYFEWFGRWKDSVFDFGGNVLNEDNKANIKCHNAHVLLDLCDCDGGITPTEWQKQQFPKEFQHKIKVIHDGIDTEICKPDKNVKFLIKDKNIELTKNDEVITYATRGMEPYRGFPQFMEAVAILQKKRPQAHFVIGGEDAVCYGTKHPQGTYKELILKKLNLNMNKIHFVGKLPFDEYIKLLQVSSVHVYLTYPFILSWSILEAMACECCIVASDTKPVVEIIKDNYNGILTDFFDINKIVEKVEYVLKNPEKAAEIGKNARQTVLEKYELKDCLAKQMEYIKEIIRNKTTPA